MFSRCPLARVIRSFRFLISETRQRNRVNNRRTSRPTRLASVRWPISHDKLRAATSLRDSKCDSCVSNRAHRNRSRVCVHPVKRKANVSVNHRSRSNLNAQSFGSNSRRREMLRASR